MSTPVVNHVSFQIYLLTRNVDPFIKSFYSIQNLISNIPGPETNFVHLSKLVHLNLHKNFQCTIVVEEVKSIIRTTPKYLSIPRHGRSSSNSPETCHRTFLDSTRIVVRSKNQSIRQNNRRPIEYFDHDDKPGSIDRLIDTRDQRVS